MKFPVKVTYPNSEKTLTVRDQKELEHLQKIGWKVKD